MKKRRHHNNEGIRQVKRGKLFKQLLDMCKRIYGKNSCVPNGDNIRVNKEK